MKGMRAWLGVVVGSLVASAAGCTTDTDPIPIGATPSVCGNSLCEPGESSVTCAADCTACAGAVCGTCGNGVVESGEDCEASNLTKTSCEKAGFEAGGVSCKPDCTVDTSACCKHECGNPGITQCNGNLVESCNLTAAGCRLWVPASNCSDTGQTCVENLLSATCSGCIAGCPQDGATHCNGNVVETCQADTAGCLAWSPGTDCAVTGQSCDASGGTAQCSGQCVSQCALGTKQCSGAAVQSCYDAGGGCLLWKTDADCASVGAVCDPTLKACVSACATPCTTEGQQTCLGNSVNTCTKATTGCLGWAPTQDCSGAGSGWLCKPGPSQTASCEPPCSDPCTTAGATQCKFNAIQTCVSAGGTCLEWQSTSTCPSGQTCGTPTGTPMCVTAPMTGEDCSTAWKIQGGTNNVTWTATQAVHLVTPPSCSAQALDGPDVVLRYDPTFTGSIDLNVNKPASHRWTMIVSDQACGVMTSFLACVSEFTNATMGTTVPVTSGKPVYVYIRDTTSGTAPLDNPLVVTVAELNCGTFNATPTIVSPANGSTTNTLSPVLEVDFDTAIKTNQGVITLTGPGVNQSYDLATSPGAVTWQNAGKKLLINAPALPAGASVTVSWTGMQDSTCSKPVNPPTWAFTVVTPPCSPGAGGMVGSTVTSLATGTPLITEYYVEADTNPNGWVYVGGTASLYRTSKNGGPWENVYVTAGLSTVHVGYSMLVDGSDLYTVDDRLSGNTQRLWRISTTGGTNYAVSDYASFQGSPSDDLRAVVAYKGTAFMLTHEGTTGELSEIWKVATGASTLPATAQFERSFSELNCSGLAADDTYFYAACSNNNRLVKIHRTTGAVTLITSAFPLATLSYVNHLKAHDQNNDGVADYLYFTNHTGNVYFVCNPGGANPYADKLATFNSTATLSFGLGFDPVAKKLYAYNDSTQELVVIQ